MIIKLENYHSYYRDNFDYNRDIKSLITELFETNSTGRIKYKISEDSNFHSSKRHHYFSQVHQKREYLKPQSDDGYKNHTKYNGKLGPLEFSLASYLLNPNMEYDVFVLTGALGSGKSSLCNYTLDFIKNSNLPEKDPLHFPNHGLIHRINFNEHFDSDIKDEIVQEFKHLLIAKLTSLIEKIHNEDLFINSFIEKINKKDNERYELFSSYARKVTTKNLVTEEQKFNYLVNWLEKYNDSLSFKLRLLSYLLGFIKERKSNNKRVDFIILFDNIDKLNDDAQIEVLNIIFSFSVKLNIKILVPMRLTTFGKIKGNGSYSFAVFQNTGHPPISIFSERIKHFLNNIDEYNLPEKVSKDYRFHLISKFKFIFSQLEDDAHLNRLTNFFTSISGNSIRRGLYLSERLFLNSVVHYKDDENYQDEFLKALLVSDNENSKMQNDDRIVNNIFATTEGANSLLKLRILQILDYHRENNITCRMSVLLSQIALFEDYNSEEICNAINDLIFYRRRLVYVEGVKEYSDFKNLSQSNNDVIHITYSGVEYLTNMVFNTVYLQNCFAVISWKIPNSFKNIDYLAVYIEKMSEQQPDSTEILYLKNVINTKKFKITDFIDSSYDYRDLKERMKLLRSCLSFLMINDLNQLSLYYENNNIHNPDSVEDRYIKNSIVIDIIAKTSFSVLNILRASLTNREEVENWYNFILTSHLWHTTVLKSDNKLLENSINQYEAFLKN